MGALTRTGGGWNWKTQSSSFVEIYSIHLGRRHFHLQWPAAFKDCTENAFPLIWRSWCIFSVVCSILDGVPGNKPFFVHSACKDRAYHYHSNSKWLNMPQFMVEWLQREDLPVDLQFELTQLTQLSWAWLPPTLTSPLICSTRQMFERITHICGRLF